MTNDTEKSREAEMEEPFFLTEEIEADMRAARGCISVPARP